MELMICKFYKRITILILLLVLSVSLLVSDTNESFYIKGRFYQDWMGLKGDDTELYSRLSSRLKLTLWNRPGDGWTADFDIRNRYTFSEKGDNQLIVYDAKIFFRSMKSKFFLSIGQMNLYDVSGIGELTGILAGYKPFKNISAGGYYGIEPDLYGSRIDSKYRKFGGFIKYLGPGARQVSISFNNLSFDGQIERQYLSSSIFYPYKRLFSVFGTAEYEIAGNIANEDRLARLFLNARFNISKKINVTGSYSSGRGLDYHRFAIEHEENQLFQISEIERFYYNTTYGVRISFRPAKNCRLSFSRRESERVDEGIKNHTSRFGFSSSNILNSGFSLSANYNMNRGDKSESDSYYISTSRYFGRFNASISFSSYFNAIYTGVNGQPEITYIPDRRTISTSLFYILNRNLAFSMEYAYSFQDDYKENRAFVRMIIRK